MSENRRSLQIFQSDRENLLIRIAIQTVPPQIRRFADDSFQTIVRDFRFPFIAMNAIHATVRQLDRQIAFAAAPFAAAVTEQHVAHKLQQRRFAAFIFTADNGQSGGRRLPGNILINAVSLQL